MSDTLTIDREWAIEHARAWASNHYGSDALGLAFALDYVSDDDVPAEYRHYASAWEQTSEVYAMFREAMA